MAHLVEVFIGGCPLCREALEIVEKAVCPECTIKIYNLYERPEDPACKRKVEAYEIRAVPTIVVDGQVKIEGKPTLEKLREVLGA